MPNHPAILPQLCTPAAVPPSGSDWVHEVKHDGHRILTFLGSVHMRTRAGTTPPGASPQSLPALFRLKVKSTVLDGEVAVPDENGVTHLSYLDEALKSDPGARCSRGACLPHPFT